MIKSPSSVLCESSYEVPWLSVLLGAGQSVTGYHMIRRSLMTNKARSPARIIDEWECSWRMGRPPWK